MEYERIDKVQNGIISPSKLRMKLLGPHNLRKNGSNSNSSRTSPSRVEDVEFVNSLLAQANRDEEVASPSLDVPPTRLTGEAAMLPRQTDQTSCQPKESFPRENSETTRVKFQQCNKADSSNSSAIHQLRIMEDENLDYDSNASSSSFEFHKGERIGHNPISRSLSRPMSSKWNDAEKWIMNRQNIQATYPKRNALQNQTNRFPVTNMGKVAPECANANYDYKLSISRMGDTKRVDFSQPASQMGYDRFSFVPAGSHPISGQAYLGNAPIDQFAQSKDLKEVVQSDVACSTASEDTTGIPAIRSVSMRDMGTEMTPVTSQEPSRTATPIESSTPLRSPISSIPSTPRRGAPASTPMDHTTDEESQHANRNRKELSEEEMKLKTRREIVALGVQLGKMNIAAWASKAEQEKKRSSPETTDVAQLERAEFEKRAASWEETGKSKHLARYKREEIKIQAWESHQKLKLEADMRRIEAQVEQMRAQAQAKMVKKIAMARQRSEEKRAAAEARKNRDAERTAAQAEYIRQTGKLPSFHSHYVCCGWL